MVEESNAQDINKDSCTIDWDDQVPLAAIIENVPNHHTASSKPGCHVQQARQVDVEPSAVESVIHNDSSDHAECTDDVDDTMTDEHPQDDMVELVEEVVHEEEQLPPPPERPKYITSTTSETSHLLHPLEKLKHTTSTTSEISNQLHPPEKPTYTTSITTEIKLRRIKPKKKVRACENPTLTL